MVSAARLRRRATHTRWDPEMQRPSASHTLQTHCRKPTNGESRMNPNKVLWEKGDFTKIASTMRESGDALIARLGITPGLKVLDLGSGDGTTALPAAKRGAEVLGVDIASNLVAAGNARAKEAGLANMHFQEGDAGELQDLADARFDTVG